MKLSSCSKTPRFPKIDNQIKAYTKITKEWKELKDIQKHVKKEIAPLV
jgi:phosphopantothenate synthetase